MKQRMKIYTDGGCTGNPGPGGWAAVVLEDEENPIELSGGSPSTTNNRMELTAVIEALKMISVRFGKDESVEVHTDSQYVQKGISLWMKGWIAKGWKTASGKPVKNKDLWLTLRDLDTGMDVKWLWVKGHSGNHWNERCDELVAAQRSLFSED